MKQWDINAVNATDFSSLEIGMIDSSTAQSIGITGATDWFQIIRIPWNTTYPGQILLTAAGKQEMYYRTCSNGTWQTPKRLVTNADISYGNLGAGNFGAVEGRWQKFGQIITFAGFIQSISGASGAWGTLATIPHTSISQIMFRPLLNSTGNEPIVRDGNISDSNIKAWLANEDNGKYIFFSGTYVCNN